MNCVMKSRRCVRKEGKKVQEGVYIVYLLLGQQVHRAEVIDILDIADVSDIANIADIAIDLGKAVSRRFGRDFIAIWSGFGKLLSCMEVGLIVSKMSS